jgi:hypothetical protein
MTIAEITQKLTARSCAACKFLSDQDAHASSAGLIVAKCLSPKSDHSGKYRREDASCVNFARGESIDLPEAPVLKRTA